MKITKGQVYGSIGIVVFIVFACGLIMYLMDWYVGETVKGINDISWFGNFGSFIGGFTSSAFSAIAFLGVLFSLRRQDIESKKSDKARIKSEELINFQIQNAQIQQFESTFFSLLDIHNNLLSKITEIDKDNLSLVERKLCCVLELTMDSDAPEEFDKKYPNYAKHRKVADRIKSLHFLDDPSLKLYLMGLLQLLIFIDMAEESSQQSYCDIVKSLVPNEVLHIVMFSCFFYQQETNSDRKSSWEKYGSLFSYVEKYSFLEHIRFSYAARNGMMMSLVTNVFHLNNNPNSLPYVHALRIFGMFSDAFGSNCRQINIFFDTCRQLEYKEIKTLITPFNDSSYLSRYYKNNT